MKSRIFFMCIMICIIVNANAQQDVQFSQYVFNGLAVNPAYAGYKEDWYLSGVYRQQWVGITGAPQTGALSVDGLTKAKNKNVGVGAQLTFDKLGPQTIYTLTGSYAYRIQLDKADTKRLCLGLSFGVRQNSIDASSLVAVDPDDHTVLNASGTAYTPNAKFGVYYYTPKYYLGLSVLDLFSIDNKKAEYNNIISSIQTIPHFYLTGGMLVNIGDEVKLKSSFMLKQDFQGPSSLDLNVFALLSDRLWVGTSYRTAVRIWNQKQGKSISESSGAMSGLIELFASESLRIGYSYDFVTNGLQNYQSGSHEISLGVLFPNKKDREHIVNPRLF